MDENMISCLNGFEKLWERVENTDELEAISDPEPENTTLMGFIRDETDTAAFYRELACHTSGRMRQTLAGAYEDESRHLRKLQVEYFLRNGDTYYVEKPAPSGTGGLAAKLREAYNGEKSAAAGYMAAASRTRDERLRELYAEFSKEELGHAAMDRSLIENMFR